MADTVDVYIREASGKDVQPIDCYWWKCTNCKRRDIFRSCNFCPSCGLELNWIADESKGDKL